MLRPLGTAQWTAQPGGARSVLPLTSMARRPVLRGAVPIRVLSGVVCSVDGLWIKSPVHGAVASLGLVHGEPVRLVAADPHLCVVDGCARIVGEEERAVVGLRRRRPSGFRIGPR